MEWGSWLFLPVYLERGNTAEKSRWPWRMRKRVNLKKARRGQQVRFVQERGNKCSGGKYSVATTLIGSNLIS